MKFYGRTRAASGRFMGSIGHLTGRSWLDKAVAILNKDEHP